jgi:hypothetical protein
MRVLFFMRSTVYVRNFESTLRMLAERGHEVHVVADVHRQLDPTDLMGRLCRDYPRIRHSEAPARRSDRVLQLGITLRGALDYLRYLRPEYRDAPKLRHRAELKAPAFVMSALRRPFMNTAVGRSLLSRVIRWCDRAVPRDPDIDAYVRGERPDLVLVTPLVEPGSPQSEYLRSARALGIPTGLCVYSWDNLTNKGLIHESLDVVTVWNQPMRDEAVTLHGVPSDRVVVTGAAPYDHWFTWTPRAERAAFCARVGLDASHPYLLYLCSSKFIAPDELPFVRRWIQDIRAASSVLRETGVIIRPHPQNTDAWREADFGDLANVAIWPRAGANPVDADSRADYYDSIHHSAAVVGVNTSAQIESAIVGRGVFTLLAREFRDTQEGTLHFRHLRDVNGGLVHAASDIAEHVAQLEQVVRNPQLVAEKCRRFVETFVRPHGMEQPATPRLVAAIEAAAARRATADRGPWWAVLVRPMLMRAAAALEASPETGERRKKVARDAEAAARRVRKAEKQKRRAAGNGASASPMQSDAFGHYLHIRDYLRAMKQCDAVSEQSTPVEQKMLASLEPLWDTGPETIGELRHLTKGIGGVPRSDYHGAKSDLIRARLDRDLRTLLEESDHALWIAEPTALGGFGFNGLGKLYNEDTLRFFRVLSLLDDAALLKEFRGSSASRHVVWEIGGGWGGFAYQFKTLCPNVTYLITGPPALLLVSAVYLTTLFPTACFRFYEPARPETFWRDWSGVDFAFAPEGVVADMRPSQLDLVVDLMTLERMTTARIDRHVQRAHDLGSRYFVSMCPSGNPDPDTASRVLPVVERFYWRHPLCAPRYLASRLGVRAGSKAPIPRTYFLGWRRLHA